MLRLLGLKVLDDCGACAHKVLRTMIFYPFCQDYREDGDNQYTLAKQYERTETQKNLYNVGDVSVQVNAIVGKNGDGKSSVIEIILRLLNNFAYCYGFRYDQDSLQYNISVGAILYYELDDHIYAISCSRGDCEMSEDGSHCRVQWYKDGQCISSDFPAIGSEYEKKKWLLDNHAEEIFYSLVINYSIYSYNSQLLRAENKPGESWIDALFHKNDAYQTPLVLNPMRIDGNIDINREFSLSHQRLMSLYTMSADEPDQMKFKEDRHILGFGFSMENVSKLMTKTVYEYFVQNHWREYEIGVVNENVLQHCVDFWESFIEDWDNGSKLIDYAKGLLRGQNFNRTNQTDLSILMQKFVSMQEESDKYSEPTFPMHKFAQGTLKNMNFAELYRLVLIIMVWKFLREEIPSVIDCTLNDAFDRSKDPKFAARLYICYKIIEIMQTYLPYYRRSYIADESFELFCNPIENNPSFKRLKDDVKEILRNDDYTTLKLRQCINYIRYSEDDYYQASGTPVITQTQIYTHLLPFAELKKVVDHVRSKSGVNEIIHLLPPPIFEGDIIVEAVDDAQRYTLRELSSGELQRLNSVSVLLYHLRNLDNRLVDINKIQYRNVWVVFEEVELYFHPEYQKSFVAYLLDQIERMHLRNIKSINITFVSHSPFILTDMLKNNILFLRDGEIKNVETETFAGNLYDLMHDSFFLENNAMGDFAADYVKKLVTRKNEDDVVKEEETEIVGDSILKNYLQA